MNKKLSVTLHDLTMSRCSRLTLFSSSSLTTSMWPSFAAEISAVQQSCTHRQPVTLETAIRLQNPDRRTFARALRGTLRKGQSYVPTSWSYQMLMGTRCRMDVQECQRAKRERRHRLEYLIHLSSCARVQVFCVIAGSVCVSW